MYKKIFILFFINFLISNEEEFKEKWKDIVNQEDFIKIFTSNEKFLPENYGDLIKNKRKFLEFISDLMELLMSEIKNSLENKPFSQEEIDQLLKIDICNKYKSFYEIMEKRLKQKMPMIFYTNNGKYKEEILELIKKNLENNLEAQELIIRNYTTNMIYSPEFLEKIRSFTPTSPLEIIPTISSVKKPATSDQKLNISKLNASILYSYHFEDKETEHGKYEIFWIIQIDNFTKKEFNINVGLSLRKDFYRSKIEAIILISENNHFFQIKFHFKSAVLGLSINDHKKISIIFGIKASMEKHNLSYILYQDKN